MNGGEFYYPVTIACYRNWLSNSSRRRGSKASESSTATQLRSSRKASQRFTCIRLIWLKTMLLKFWNSIFRMKCGKVYCNARACALVRENQLSGRKMTSILLTFGIQRTKKSFSKFIKRLLYLNYRTLLINSNVILSFA